MNNVTCRTDLISLKESPGVAGLPSNVDQRTETRVTVYFESATNQRAFMNIPVECPNSELSVSLDNPADEYIDEG